MAKILRTPTRVTGGITAEERAQLDGVAREWIDCAYRTEPIDREQITDEIHRLYAAAGLDRPRVVVAPSPVAMALVYGAASAVWYWREQGWVWPVPHTATDAATRAATRAATLDATRAATDAATDAATLDATDAATRAATDAATRAATRAATLDATRAATDAATLEATYAATRAATLDATLDATYDATYAATRAATYAATVAATLEATYAATRAATDAATLDATDAATLEATYAATRAAIQRWVVRCAQRWWVSYQGGNMWAAVESYLAGFRDVLGLDLSTHAGYSAWEGAARAGGFRCLHEKFCVVSDFPLFIRRDDRNLPHCEDGPSHQWRDGWALYHWHGVRVPREWIEERDTLDPTIALTWENVEERRAAAEIVGWDRVLQQLSVRPIDTDPDPEIGALIEVDIPDIGTERFLRVQCGTGRTFALPVPPDVETALDANAWTYGVDGDTLSKLEVRT